jgi:hypothetical protein
MNDDDKGQLASDPRAVAAAAKEPRKLVASAAPAMPEPTAASGPPVTVQASCRPQPQSTPTKHMDKILSWFVGGWIAIAIVVNVGAIIGVMIGAHRFWAGWALSAGYLQIVLLSPAIGAYAWLQRRRKRAAPSDIAVPLPGEPPPP